MTTYTIYFELYGKKMRTTVKAKSIDQAKQIIRDAVIFHKVKEDEPFDFKSFEKDVMDFLNGFKR